ncbi:MAG: DNA methyltransferase [Pseudomonadales bacterium]
MESRVCGTFKEKQETPNQMPIEVLNRIVLATSKPGDLVVDPFNGSGTTGAAAANTGEPERVPERVPSEFATRLNASHLVSGG